jgi:hypothetical protein
MMRDADYDFAGLTARAGLIYAGVLEPFIEGELNFFEITGLSAIGRVDERRVPSPSVWKAGIRGKLSKLYVEGVFAASRFDQHSTSVGIEVGYELQ